MITEPYLKHVKNYLNCFQNKCGRLFRRIENRQATKKVIGKNTLAKARIAQFLGLDNFNRTSATILADKGYSILKKAGRWSSSKVVDRYIDD